MAATATNTKVIPLNDKILVKRFEAEGKSVGGIILPDAAQEKPRQGTVLAVGEGKLLSSGKRVVPIVKKGNKVLFSSYGGTEVTIDGDELLLLTEEDILAIID